MKVLRPILLAVVLVAAFYYFTTHFRDAITPSGPSSAPLEVTQASGPQSFDAEEKENIAVYKKALPSGVNITSTAVAFDFFYGPLPQKRQGSCFVLDKKWPIVTHYHVVSNSPTFEVT